MSSGSRPRIPAEEYLALERRAEHRSELFDGRIRAMTGASRQHNRIVLNLVAALHAQLRGRPCEAFFSVFRIKVSGSGFYTYPDVAALCGEPRFEDDHLDTLLNPSVLVEVLSESTERYDRGEKFARYRRLDSLREYVLVSQDRMRVERFRRDGDFWIFSESSGPEGELALEAIDCRVPLRDLYERVDFPDDPPAG
jgi:Uma2 family endonuclease